VEYQEKRRLASLSSNAEKVATGGNIDKPFPFIKLPAKIRNKIYALVATNEELSIGHNHFLRSTEKPRSDTPKTWYQHRILSNGPVNIWSAYSFWSCDIANPRISNRTLLLVNQQLRREYAPFFYGRKHHFRSVQCIVPYLQDQPEWVLPYITSIMFQPDGDEPSEFVWPAFKQSIEYMRQNLQIRELGLVKGSICWSGAWNGLDGPSLTRVQWVRLLATLSGHEDLRIYLVLADRASNEALRGYKRMVDALRARMVVP
ncbi:MAG: hypothetical protein M1835_000560, partial [Candelina submexicana]